MNKQQIIQRQLKTFHEFFLRFNNTFQQLPKKHRVIILSVASIALFIMILPSEHELATKNINNQSFEIGKRYQVAIPENSTGSKTRNAY